MTAPRIPRNAPCPCGSREKYKHCCIDGMRRVVVRVTEPATSNGHPECYAHPLLDCSNELTREHVVSERILRAMASEDPDGVLTVTNAFWQATADVIDRLKPKALAAKVLCSRHNNALSPLDDVGGRFFELLGAIVAGRNKLSNAFVSGSDLERFLVKVAAGWIASGNAMTGDRKRLARDVPTDWLPSIWGNRDLVAPDGLYIDMSPAEVRDAKPHFALQALTDQQTDAPAGLEAVVHGIRFLLLVGSRGRRPVLAERFGFRPKQLVFEGACSPCTVGFAWADGSHSFGATLVIEPKVVSPSTS